MVVTKSLAKTASQSALNQSVQFLKGVGPKRSEIFTKLGIDTIRDVLFYFPRDYKDRTRIQRISEAKIGAEITIQGRVLGIQTRMARSRKSILEIFVGDGTGAIAATWFNQPFLANKFHVGDMVFLHGKVGAYKYLQLLGPEYEVIRENEIDVKEGSVVPVYSLTEHMSQTHFRKIMKMAVHQFAGHIEEILPKEITKKNQLVSINDAVRNIHFPGTFENLEHARCRLIYEELFILELAMALRRRGIKEETGISFKIGANVDTHIRNLIPFALTNAQERVINEITEDMRSSKPMNRLLQGDVGSGKTVVAIYAILAAIANGYQVAFMTPTEILAKQHFQTIQKYLEHSHVRIQLLTGDTNSRQKKDNLDQIKTGQIDLIIGTHALIEETVQFRQLGLVVIDEQHKFGVVQRLKLKKKGLCPDVLIMTATPIPRTLSLTLFGDLDISMLDEMPPGRSPVRTIWVTQDKEKKKKKKTPMALSKVKLPRAGRYLLSIPLLKNQNLLI